MTFKSVNSVIKACYIALFIALLPVVAFYLFLPQSKFAYNFGLIPGDVQHLQGVFFMPFAHADSGHLWGNTMQLFFGVLLVFLHFRHLSKTIMFIQWVGTGLILFFIGKTESLHIGSSGIIYGLFSFLILAGFIAGNRRLRLQSFMLLMYYGGMVWGIFPWQEKVSWEGHLSGAIAGTLSAIILSKWYRTFTRDKRPAWFYDSAKWEDPYSRFNRKD